jgi:hypothetical protein
MPTTDSSFIAQGPGANGFYANVQGGGAFRGNLPPFKFGALAVGHYAGVYGATDDFPLPPATRLWGNAGVLGASDSNYGVAGLSYDNIGVSGSSANLPGVWGGSVYHNGVAGQSLYGFGVGGTSSSGPGVWGWSPNSNGVVGQSDTNVGVVGYAGPAGPPVPNPDLPGNAAIIGSSDNAPGVIGTSRAQAGVYGYSAAGDGVVGHSTNYAGFFIGNLLVVNGIKAAAVPFPDRTHRVLYCMESPELWFEDFGTAKLRRGRAVVKLDADFAKVIKRGDYRVFPAPEGDCRGLYVRRKSASSFEVRELMGGKSNVAFSYRIVGRRKDIKQQHRFAKIDALRRVPPQRRTTRSAERAKIPQTLRAFARRMEKVTTAQLRKRGRKRKGAAS